MGNPSSEASKKHSLMDRRRLEIAERHQNFCIDIVLDISRQCELEHVFNGLPYWSEFETSIEKLNSIDAFTLFMHVVHVGETAAFTTNELFAHRLLVKRFAKLRKEPLFSHIADQFLTKRSEGNNQDSIDNRTQHTFNAYIPEGASIVSISSDAYAVVSKTGRIEGVSLAKEHRAVACADLFEKVDTFSVEEMFALLNAIKKYTGSIDQIPVDVNKLHVKTIDELLDMTVEYSRTVQWDRAMKQFEQRTDMTQPIFEDEQKIADLRQELGDLVRAFQEAGIDKEIGQYEVQLPLQVYTIEEVSQMPEYVPYSYAMDDIHVKNALQALYDPLVFFAVGEAFGEAFQQIPLRSQLNIIWALIDGEVDTFTRYEQAIKAPGVDPKAVLGACIADHPFWSVLDKIANPEFYHKAGIPFDDRSVRVNTFISGVCQEYMRVVGSIARFSIQQYGAHSRAAAQHFMEKATTVFAKSIDTSRIYALMNEYGGIHDPTKIYWFPDENGGERVNSLDARNTYIARMNGEVAAFAALFEVASLKERAQLMEAAGEIRSVEVAASELNNATRVSDQMVDIYTKNHGQESSATKNFIKSLEKTDTDNNASYHCVFFGEELILFYRIDAADSTVHISGLNVNPEAQGLQVGSIVMAKKLEELDNAGTRITAEGRINNPIMRYYLEVIGFSAVGISQVSEGETNPYQLVDLVREHGETSLDSQKMPIDDLKNLIREHGLRAPIEIGDSELYCTVLDRRAKPEDLANIFSDLFDQGYRWSRCIPCGGPELCVFERKNQAELTSHQAA